ncbi:protein Esc2p [Monosporozyma unispora]
MSSSDSDDDFFNVAQSEADYNFDEANVLIQSKTQLSTNLNLSKNTPLSNGPLERSSSEESLVSLRKTDTEKKIESAKKDDTITTMEDKSLERGRTRTRSEFISSSSSSSEDYGLERSRSNSLDLEHKRPKRITTEPDENDDFFRELEKMSSPTTTNSVTNLATELDKEKFSDLDINSSSETTPLTASRSSSIPMIHSNPKRIYKIRFLSKLEGTINKSVQVKVLGKYTFEKILPPALAGLIKAFKVPSIMKKFYEPNNVSLYRNESMKLLKFMNCNSLNIPQSFENEISDVEIVLVSKDNEKEYEKEINDKIFEDKDSIADSTTESTLNKNKSIGLDKLQFEQQFEDELKDNETSVNATGINLESSEMADIDEPLMKIALLGHDNKKLYVNVRNSTPFSKLVDYYRIQKQLPQSKKIILSFDHDDLDLNECVKDQDMEDEDVIDVIVK